jgi:hypothetical protein
VPLPRMLGGVTRRLQIFGEDNVIVPKGRLVAIMRPLAVRRDVSVSTCEQSGPCGCA